MKRVIRAASQPVYDKNFDLNVKGRHYFVKYTGGEEFQDDLKMFHSFKAMVTEIHPYDDAEYAWARIANGTIEFIQNGRVIDKTQYMTATDWDVENDEWCDLIVRQAAEMLADINKSVKPRMMHN